MVYDGFDDGVWDVPDLPLAVLAPPPVPVVVHHVQVFALKIIRTVKMFGADEKSSLHLCNRELL